MLGPKGRDFRCPYAKSMLTPCYLRDGEVTEVEIRKVLCCVGCERSFEGLRAEYGIDQTEPRSFGGYTLDDLEKLCRERRSVQTNHYKRVAAIVLPFLVARLRQIEEEARANTETR